MNGVSVHGSRDGLILMDALRFLLRHFRLVSAFSISFSVVTAVVLLVLPATFEGSAMLVIIPPKISSDLKPSSLTVQGYQKLLESDEVVQETRRRLIEQKILKPKDRFRINDDLETRIFVSRYSETVALAPMVQVVVRRDSAEHAAIAANIWGEVFLRRVRELTLGSTSAQVKFVDEQYPKSQERLTAAENERGNQRNDYHRRMDEVTKTWDEKVLRQRNETADLLSTYEAHTRMLLEEFMGSASLITRRSQLEAVRKAFYGLQVEHTQVRAEQKKQKLQLEAARKSLAEVNTFLTLRKAITDDALWRSLVMADGKEPDWKAMQERSLITQEINPLYRDLTSRVAQLEIEDRSMGPRGKELEEELLRLSTEIKAFDIVVRQDEAKLEKMKRERESGLEQLQNKRSTDLSDLMLDRDRYLDALRTERDSRLAQLDRVVTQEKELNSELAKNFNQALLAKAQQSSEEVRIGAVAVPSEHPLPRGVVLGAILAALAGSVVGVVVVVVREAAADLRPAA